MKKTGLILFIPLLLAACGRSGKTVTAPEEIYDSEGLFVITSSFNASKQTLSTLYGNAAALKAAGDSSEPSPGEDYRLVTWKQKPQALWFGSNVSGELSTIERVSTATAADGSVKVSYEILKGTVDGKQDRTAFILAQKPSVFP